MASRVLTVSQSLAPKLMMHMPTLLVVPKSFWMYATFQNALGQCLSVLWQLCHSTLKKSCFWRLWGILVVSLGREGAAEEEEDQMEDQHRTFFGLQSMHILILFLRVQAQITWEVNNCTQHQHSENDCPVIPEPYLVIYPDIPFDSTGFFSGKHWIRLWTNHWTRCRIFEFLFYMTAHFLANKMQHFRIFVLHKSILNFDA